MNLLLMTSTKGHFDRTDIYRTIVDDLDEQLGKYYFTNKLAHIKVSQGGGAKVLEMDQYLKEQSYTVMLITGEWKHGDQSHQSEYLKDIRRAINYLSSNHASEYTLFMEDDWIIRPQKNEGMLWDYLHKAQVLLGSNPDLVQVRIPRFNNEFDRINRLFAKHRIEAKAEAVEGDGIIHFRTNDWSNNPFIARTRDIYQAMVLMQKNPHAFPDHAEHGWGRAMKYLSPAELPLAVIKPDECRCFHFGTKYGEEDKINAILHSD